MVGFRQVFKRPQVIDKLDHFERASRKRYKLGGKQTHAQTSPLDFQRDIHPIVREILRPTSYVLRCIERRLQTLVSRQRDAEHHQKVTEPRAPQVFTFHEDLLLWATLVGDLEFAETLWAQTASEPDGDPIRMALLASQVSRRCAEACRRDTKEEARYFQNADKFEQWACDVLRQCRHDEDAELVSAERGTDARCCSWRACRGD